VIDICEESNALVHPFMAVNNEAQVSQCQIRIHLTHLPDGWLFTRLLQLHERVLPIREQQEPVWHAGSSRACEL